MEFNIEEHKYLVLSHKGRFVPCYNLTQAIACKDGDESLTVIDITDAREVTVPKYTVIVNGTRGEVTVHRLDGTQVFAITDGIVLSAMDHMKDIDTEIYHLIEEYYMEELQEFELV